MVRLCLENFGLMSLTARLPLDLHAFEEAVTGFRVIYDG